jgi:hypothetical protein
MKAKQISIFLENRPKQLSGMCKALSAAGVNISTLSLADSADFGIVRMIVDDHAKGCDALAKAGFAVIETDVVTARVPDRPGGMAEIMEKHFSWPDVRAVFDQWESDIGAILPRHIERWKNLTMEKWDKNIRSARYYARVRPLKVPALLQTAMKLTDAEVETYFGETLRLLNETNADD